MTLSLVRQNPSVRLSGVSIFRRRSVTSSQTTRFRSRTTPFGNPEVLNPNKPSKRSLGGSRSAISIICGPRFSLPSHTSGARLHRVDSLPSAVESKGSKVRRELLKQCFEPTAMPLVNSTSVRRLSLRRSEYIYFDSHPENVLLRVGAAAGNWKKFLISRPQILTHRSARLSARPSIQT